MRIDGFDIRQLDPIALRRHIGYVSQQPEIFSGTVIENLRFARPLASEDEIRQALVLADAWEEISRLEGGVNAHISAADVPEALAARLSLARGYLHGGSILLIDELPAAILQGKAGGYLKRFLQRTHGKRTVIFVSQQQELLEVADSVVEIVDGKLEYLKRAPQPQTATQEAIISYFTPRKESA